jgi:hypothetical protein
MPLISDLLRRTIVNTTLFELRQVVFAPCKDAPKLRRFWPVISRFTAITYEARREIKCWRAEWNRITVVSIKQVAMIHYEYGANSPPFRIWYKKKRTPPTIAGDGSEIKTILCSPIALI